MDLNNVDLVKFIENTLLKTPECLERCVLSDGEQRQPGQPPVSSTEATQEIWEVEIFTHTVEDMGHS